MLRRLRRPLWFLLGLLVPYLGLCAYLANSFVHPKRYVPPTPDWARDAKVGDRPVWVTPGLAMGRPSKVVVVFAHGFRGSRTTWMKLMQRLNSAGIDGMAMTMPGMDASPEKTVGFGLPEAKAVLDAAHWARSYGAEEVVGVGLSLGGSAMWLAVREDPKALDGVVTDAAFVRLDQALDAFLSRRLAIGRYVLRPVVWMAQVMVHVDVDAVRPIEGAERWRGRPALVIQGMDDTLIKPFNGERLAQAAGCPIWRIDGAEHSHTYDADPEAYLKRIMAFVKQIER